MPLPQEATERTAVELSHLHAAEKGLCPLLGPRPGKDVKKRSLPSTGVNGDAFHVTACTVGRTRHAWAHDSLLRDTGEGHTVLPVFVALNERRSV